MRSLEAINPVYKNESFDYAKRRYYDTATWLAEVLHGNMRSEFQYTYQRGDLYASDGSSMAEIFNDAVLKAEALPSFEKRRRLVERSEYQDMLSMMDGDLPNTMIVVSDFPAELQDCSQDEIGYNTQRKQTMLRVVSKGKDNKITVLSQSLDMSDRESLENIYRYFNLVPAEGELLGQRIHIELDEHTQKTIADTLVGVYDRSLSAKYGGDYYAGIRNGSTDNTYDFVQEQSDLINSYLAVTEKFLSGKKEYGLAAAMLARYNNKSSKASFSKANMRGSLGIVSHVMALSEMEEYGDAALQQGITVSGCGVSIGIEMNGEDQYDELGYGSKTMMRDKYGPLRFKCPKKSCGYINKRPRNKLIKYCQKCKADVSCG